MKPEEQQKPIKDTPNNQSRAAIIFNDLINKRKESMSDLYDSVDYNNLNFEYVGPTKDVIFYEYRDSKELFNAIKNSRIKFSTKQKGVINNITRFYLSGEETINLLETMFKCYLMQITMLNKMRLREKDLKY